MNTIVIKNPTVPHTNNDHNRSGNDLSDEKHNSTNNDIVITIKYSFNKGIIIHLLKNIVKLIQHKQNKMIAKLAYPNAKESNIRSTIVFCGSKISNIKYSNTHTIIYNINNGLNIIYLR